MDVQVCSTATTRRCPAGLSHQPFVCKRQVARQRRSRHSRTVTCAATEDVVLVRKEERGGDTTVFVFGTESEKKAASKERPPSPSSESSASSPSTSAQTSSSSQQQTSVQPDQIKEVAAKVEEAVQKEKPIEEPLPIPSSGGASTDQQNSPIAPEDALRNLTVEALREVCKQSGLTGYSKLRKEDLVKFVIEEMKH